MLLGSNSIFNVCFGSFHFLRLNHTPFGGRESYSNAKVTVSEVTSESVGPREIYQLKVSQIYSINSNTRSPEILNSDCHATRRHP